MSIHATDIHFKKSILGCIYFATIKKLKMGWVYLILLLSVLEIVTMK